MTRYESVQAALRQTPKIWLVTGVAGFIGSNILEKLLKLDQMVVGLDNFSTGYQRNLDEVQGCVTEEQWARFKFIKGDIRNLDDCKQSVEGVDYVLHQAALGSVPRSIEDPLTTNSINVSGFLNVIIASRDANVDSVVYAASSSTYGDHPGLPKVEHLIGRPLSPYAVTKYVNELYADVFGRSYGLKSVGLRYFNIFGPRQDPNGAYAAVIPKWVASMINNENLFMNGDGETSRDFCFVENAVQANILAATAKGNGLSEVYNVAVNARTTLNELFSILKVELMRNKIIYDKQAIYREFRDGDVRHSQADISKAQKILGYDPLVTVQRGVALAMPWYIRN